jgi:hypothetical protein
MQEILIDGRELDGEGLVEELDNPLVTLHDGFSCVARQQRHTLSWPVTGIRGGRKARARQWPRYRYRHDLAHRVQIAKRVR